MISLVTWNIQYGRGRDDRVDLERQADLLRPFDIIGLQEVERFWRRTGEVDQVARLAELLPDHYHVYGPATDILKQHGPGPKGAVRRQFGNAVFSRFPILIANSVTLPRRAAMGIPTSARIALDTILELPSGRHLRFCSTHLDHAQADLRLEQADALLRLYREAALSGGISHGAAGRDHPWWGEEIQAPPVPPDMVLVGDFNLTPKEPAYARLVGACDPHFGRVAHLDGFADAWTLSGHAEEEGMTWWDDPQVAPRRLDYVLVTAGLAPLVRSCRILPGDLSDHQPVAVELELD
ncbi:MAG TPA: endonuclease/exonuclease/phosphatase family protein [Geminicoccus sp.]|uniref:endonuclease/exonuclease/phosphatase family protein n=1 Tax=Geminicoccus sp. TaxID=2024832 RepID=UPI002BC78253|nr:endonuclease/exonuclease/phosphatase family protein [Geminicoccus sp.]HWL66895.1 endonuclease/exonuclease/phosphatase family protein [Geminicoccus sp.]